MLGGIKIASNLREDKTMKKLMVILLSIMMCLSLYGCQGVADAGDISGSNGNSTEKGDTETQATTEGQPTESEHTDIASLINFEAQYIRTNGGYYADINYPQVIVIRSKQELEKYYEVNREIFDLERHDKVYSDTTIGFLDACDKYTEEYFENQILILVLVEHGSGSTRDEVQEIVDAGAGVINITIQSYSPEMCTCDMAEWHIFIEPEAGVDVNPKDVLINGVSWIKK